MLMWPYLLGSFIIACPLSLPVGIEDDEETSAAGYKVKRRPVKVIGWVGALGERFPANKGLPEVVSDI